MTHGEVSELLPWYVNGTLGQDEQRTVEQHLAECRGCAGELEGLRRIGQAERAWADGVPVPERPAPALPRNEAPWSRVIQAWQTWPVTARVALAAQLLVIVALAVMAGRGQGRFTTLSGPSAAAGGRSAFVVAFHEGAPEAAIRQALAQLEARIVDGPTASGLYTIEVPVPADRPDAVDRVLARLRAQDKVVRFAARKL